MENARIIIFLKVAISLRFCFLPKCFNNIKKNKTKNPLYFGLVLDLEILINFNVEKMYLKYKTRNGIVFVMSIY